MAKLICLDQFVQEWHLCVREVGLLFGSSGRIQSRVKEENDTYCTWYTYWQVITMQYTLLRCVYWSSVNVLNLPENYSMTRNDTVIHSKYYTWCYSIRTSSKHRVVRYCHKQRINHFPVKIGATTTTENAKKWYKFDDDISVISHRLPEAQIWIYAFSKA